MVPLLSATMLAGIVDNSPSQETPSTSTFKGNPRQKAFFHSLSPHIDLINTQIAIDRKNLVSIEEKLSKGLPIMMPDQAFILALAERYGVRNVSMSNLAELKKRVDVMPRELALAQAATESAYGNSRFAKEGHNYFGQWCFTPGCGMIPRQRACGATHEVKKFTTPYESVKAYIHLLNTHPAYEKLRVLRAKHRRLKGYFTALDLVAGLEKYSERGHAYIASIAALIRTHGLAQDNTQTIRA